MSGRPRLVPATETEKIGEFLFDFCHLSRPGSCNSDGLSVNEIPVAT